MKKFWLTVVVIAIVLFAGSAMFYWQCPPTAPEIPPIIGFEDFEVYPTPRTFDGPGTVFRVNRDTKKKYAVARLDVRVEDAGDEEFPHQIKAVEWSLAAVAGFFGGESTKRYFEASGKSTVAVNVEIELGNARRYRTYDDDVAKSVAAADMQPDRNSTFYVVRETVAVQRVKIKVNFKGASDSAVTAKLKELGDAGAGTAADVKSDIVIDKRFDGDRRHIFYKVDELAPPGSGSQKNVPWKLRKAARVVWSDEVQSPE